MTRRTFIENGIKTALLASASWTVMRPSLAHSSQKRPICVFSKHLHFLNYDELGRAAADIGFDGIDLTVRPGGHVLPENVERDLPRAVAAVEKAGLKVLMLTTNIARVDEPTTEPILKTAGNLGIPFYRMAWIKYDLKKSIEMNLKEITAQMTRLAELNAKYNVQGAYQNHAGESFGSSEWDLWLVLKQINSKWLGCQYDIRHATVEGANSWPLGLRLLAPYINTLDIKDCHWGQKNGKWLPMNTPLGEGMVDWDRYFALVKELAIDAPISLFFEYPLGGAENGNKEITIDHQVVFQAMRKDLQFVREHLNKYDL